MMRLIFQKNVLAEFSLSLADVFADVLRESAKLCGGLSGTLRETMTGMSISPQLIAQELLLTVYILKVRLFWTGMFSYLHIS